MTMTCETYRITGPGWSMRDVPNRGDMLAKSLLTKLVLPAGFDPATRGVLKACERTLKQVIGSEAHTFPTASHLRRCRLILDTRSWERPVTAQRNCRPVGGSGRPLRTVFGQCAVRRVVALGDKGGGARGMSKTPSPGPIRPTPRLFHEQTAEARRPGCCGRWGAVAPRRLEGS